MRIGLVRARQSQLTKILTNKSNRSRIFSLVLLRNALMAIIQTLSRLRATKAKLYYDEIFFNIQNFTEIINYSFYGKMSK